MSFNRSIDTRTWGDRKFLALSPPPPSAQFLWFYLLTGPETCSIPGVLRIGKAALAEALGWEVEATVRCFNELEAQGMARADWPNRIVFLPNGVRYAPALNVDWVVSWAKPFDQLPDSPLKGEIYDRLLAHLIELAARTPKQQPTLRAFYESIPRVEASPPGLGSRAAASPPPQKDKEKDQEKDSSSSSSGANEKPETPDTAPPNTPPTPDFTPPPPEPPSPTPEETPEGEPKTTVHVLSDRDFACARLGLQRRTKGYDAFRPSEMEGIDEMLATWGLERVLQKHEWYLATRAVKRSTGTLCILGESHPRHPWSMFRKVAGALETGPLPDPELETPPPGKKKPTGSMGVSDKHAEDAEVSTPESRRGRKRPDPVMSYEPPPTSPYQRAPDVPPRSPCAETGCPRPSEDDSTRCWSHAEPMRGSR